jgi:hypothetical protein
MQDWIGPYAPWPRAYTLLTNCPQATLLSEDPMRRYGPILATLATLALAPVPAGTAPAPAAGAIAGNTTLAASQTPRAQGGILGRYVLRSVDGGNLPAAIPGEDVRHKLQVMDGVLTLNSDGTYICQTIVQTSYLGLVQTEADTLKGQYAPVAGASIAFRIPPKEIDTVATTGAQITWSHPVRRGIASAKFVYSK